MRVRYGLVIHLHRVGRSYPGPVDKSWEAGVNKMKKLQKTELTGAVRFHGDLGVGYTYACTARHWD